MLRATPAALVLLLASQASAQAPQPTPAPAPAAPAPPPAAAPAPAPAPAAPAPAPAPAAGEPPATPPGSPPPVTAPPGYYVEGQSPAPPQGPPPPGQPGVYEPPPPGYGPVFEPPPPPVARHVAPQTALWVGLRSGWFLPFGYLYAQGVGGGAFHRVPWSDYAHSGIMFEGDAGARLGRNYMVFALWERAQLTSGSAENNVFGGQSGGDSDFWALGLGATSDADSIGLLTEIALGYRQFRATWENGTELQFTDGILEGRIGFGASIRLSPLFTISPMATIGVGAFGEIDRVFPDGGSASVIRPGDAADSHAWFTLGVGAHVDLLGSN